MNATQKFSKINVQINDNLSVAIFPNYEHEFLLATKEVAKGYNVTPYNIRQHKKCHKGELIEGKHFINGVSITHDTKKGSSKGTMWTKRGIVRLGFFIRSDRSKMFRDWAEDLIIKVDKQTDLFGEIVSSPPKLPEKRNHNRLTQARLVDILVDVAKIDNIELRLSLIQKLGLKKTRK